MKHKVTAKTQLLQRIYVDKWCKSTAPEQIYFLFFSLQDDTPGCVYYVCVRGRYPVSFWHVAQFSRIFGGVCNEYTTN